MPGPVIPQEILDLIIDHLHDERTTLNVCCLVSKAWLPRTRKHIFIEVKFLPFGRHIPQWKRSFPDPATSPAHNVRTLSIRNPKLITTENADTLLTFCGVTHLNVDTDLREDRLVSLSLFHGFSPVVRSLHLTTTLLRNSEIFDLVCSFPLLEDLTLVSRLHRTGHDAWNHPSTSPRFTGSLELHPNSAEGIGPTAHHLLNLPNGLHFSGITVPWHSDSDVKATMDLVSTCSDTLETLDIANRLSNESWLSTVDLSKAVKLRDVVFRCRNPDARWIIRALRTAKPGNLQQVSLHMFSSVLWGTPYPEWEELDSLLVNLWVSNSLRLRIVYEERVGNGYARKNLGSRLPESTKKGIAEIVCCRYERPDFPGLTGWAW